MIESRARLCNLDRLLHAMAARNLDGIVATSAQNLFYLAGFNAIAHKSDEPRPYAVVLSRHAPEHPVAVVADYYLATFLARPGWVEDVRPFRAVMMPLDLAPARADIDRFIPAGAATAGFAHAREHYAFDMGTALGAALRDLGLERGRLAFDDPGFALRLGFDASRIADGYDALMFARAVKTAPELALLERATQLNEAAIRRTVASWRPGTSWRDLGQAYARACVDLGGFVRDPGGMVWNHPSGTDASISLQSGRDEGAALAPGTHVMFDCHGTLDLYCWDGGKTWVAGGEPEGTGKRNAAATQRVAEALLEAMRPGARVSALQSLARAAYGKAGLPDPERAVIFFHGLGLSHMDIEQRTADGRPNADWALEDGMVVPMHLLVPGGERERYWLEEVVAVTPDGGRPLFSWGFGPLGAG
ncbi:MAG TPA: M24 family metallopeptidase [Burkholderiales bacterium]|nr:M24 family metallopeptidase [Burkholderiales bacterium]